jgi:galactokinase
MLRSAFERRFGGSPSLVVRAPGRVNLIGEHTDYNDGFVMPLAIDRAAWIAARPRADRQVVLCSENFHRLCEFSLDRVERESGEDAWTNYTRGVASILEKDGYHIQGMDAVVWGDVPIGSGLSSSAALEVASALALLKATEDRGPKTEVDGFNASFRPNSSGTSSVPRLPSPVQVARLTQRAEIEFVGVNCGIMDQMISVLGQAGHALLIDCRSLAYEAVPIPSDCAIVIADSMKRRGLVDSKYNERRAECEEGARLLRIPSLRDVSLTEFEQRQQVLPGLIARRCRHVVAEDERVIACATALRAGQLERVGQLLVQSHQSLRDDYEVSCPELDTMVELALRIPGIYGARMTGAGFGGCTVNLVKQSRAATFAANLGMSYHDSTGVEPAIYICHASDGAGMVEDS